jgi:predicted metalloprotease
MRHVLATGLSFTLLASACAPKLEPQFGPNKKYMEDAVAAVAGYWEGHEITGIGNMGLRTLVGGSTRCNDQEIKADSVGVAYLCEEENIVLVIGGSYDQTEARAKESEVDPRTVGTVVIAHELGHFVLKKLGFSNQFKQSELAADCMAGVAVGAINPKLREDAIDFLKTVPTDPAKHGTADERVNAFQRGFGHDANVCVKA